jgi:hypothetical protein
MTLEFTTTDDLIQELIKRKTFVGLILHSESEQRFAGQIHNDFRLYTTVQMEETLQMLENTVHELKRV